MLYKLPGAHRLAGLSLTYSDYMLWWFAGSEIFIKGNNTYYFGSGEIETVRQEWYEFKVNV